MHIGNLIATISVGESNVFVYPVTLHHVDVDFCVAIYLGSVTTAIDVVYAGCRLHVHRYLGIFPCLGIGEGCKS